MSASFARATVSRQLCGQQPGVPDGGDTTSLGPVVLEHPQVRLIPVLGSWWPALKLDFSVSPAAQLPADEGTHPPP